MNWKHLLQESLIFLMSSSLNNSLPVSNAVRVLSGLAVSRGLARGPALVFGSNTSEQVVETPVTPAQVGYEQNRLAEALEQARIQVGELSTKLKERISGEETSIFDGHLMMLSDPLFIKGCNDHISRSLINAESAVQAVSKEFIQVFSGMDDPYLRERAKDISDIARRIISNLSGKRETISERITQPSIVVADELSPSETILLPRNLVLGFVTERGSMTSHAAVLARALGIPAVAGLGGIKKVVQHGDIILLDGNSGRIIVNPANSDEVHFDEQLQRSRALAASMDLNKQAKGITKDGFSVPILANIDNNTPMEQVRAVGAEGIGLFRTEYLWMLLGREPSEDEQFEAYATVVRAMPPEAVTTIRVLDLGGDKIAKFVHSATKEANPFLGNRSIRFLLSNPGVFRRQLRGVLRASAYGKVQVMYPMIATIEELRAANIELVRCMRSLEQEGIKFDPHIKRGIMVEIPATAIIADSLAKEVDFFSIGTNDLIQYALAVDRVNESVARLYQPTHPGVLHLIMLTIRAAHAAGLRVGVCGEAASDPVLAALLIGMGIDDLSMSPTLIPLVKSIIRQIGMSDMRELADAVFSLGTASAAQVYKFCRKRVLSFAPDLPGNE